MGFQDTPGTSPGEPQGSATGPDSRIQSGMNGSSSPVPEAWGPDSPRPGSAEVVPIRVAREDDAEYETHIPIWMQRANLVMRFLICVWVGMILCVLPWTMAWTDNALILSLPKLRAILTLDFVRGMITGIGLIDIWIGIWEAVHYHDQHPAPKSAGPA